MKSDIFERINHAPVADLVVRELEDLIVQGILVEGDRLPSERELAERFEISRPNIRIALKKLEAAGLLSIRHGEGTFVAQLTGNAMEPPLIELYARHGRAFRDYLEYRRAQEGFAARLAAHRATQTDRDEITRHLDELRDAESAGDTERSFEADVRFHVSIVNASHNMMLVHMMTSIYDLTRRGVFYNRSQLRAKAGAGEQLLQQHEAIAAAVLGGDAAAAEREAQTHLDFVEAFFLVATRQAENEATARKRALAHDT